MDGVFAGFGRYPKGSDEEKEYRILVEALLRSVKWWMEIDTSPD